MTDDYMTKLDKAIHDLLAHPAVTNYLKKGEAESDQHALLTLGFRMRIARNESDMVCALAAYGVLQYMRLHPELMAPKNDKMEVTA